MVDVVDSICDQGTENVAAINYLVTSSREDAHRAGGEWRGNYMYKVNHKIYYHIFDPPHLLKGIRSNLLTKDLLFCKNNEQLTMK